MPLAPTCSQIRVARAFGGDGEARRALLRTRLLAFYVAFQSNPSPTGGWLALGRGFAASVFSAADWPAGLFVRARPMLRPQVGGFRLVYCLCVMVSLATVLIVLLQRAGQGSL